MQLYLYEELMLLALKDKEGTIITDFPEYMIAGAILADLILSHRIAVEDTRKQLVDLVDTKPSGDPIIDEVLDKIAAAKRQASLKTWVLRLARIKNLKHKVARQLCYRGILRADEDKILFIFKRQIYPEINPLPEQELLRQLKEAILSDSEILSPRIVVLISLADSARLLGAVLGRKDAKVYKKRIAKIAKGEMAGEATREVIQACEIAVLFVVLMPVIIASTTH